MDWAAVSAIAAVCMVLGAGAGYFSRRGGTDTASAMGIRASENLAQACLAKLELLSTDLRAHEIKDAGQFADLTARVSEAQRAQMAIETRLVASVDALGTQINYLTERIDRMLEARKTSRREA